jgi:inhibitor of the pro-sigma K processing machinery
VVVVKVFSWPLKMLLKLLVNGVLGVVLLLIFNLVGKNFGVTIGINAVTALIAGFCGIPGVIFLVLFKLIM